MIVFLGDLLRNRFTGELYEVKGFRFDKVTLVAQGVPDKGWFGDEEVLGFLFERVVHGEDDPFK